MKKQKLKLDLNENAGNIYRPILSELQKRMNGVHYYTRTSDELAAKQRIAKYNKISAQNIVLTNGSYHALELLSVFLLDKNDEMIILTPTFPFYDKFEEYKKFKIKKVFYRKFTIKIDEVIKAITNRTQVIYIANPNNPIGTVLARQDLLLLIKFCTTRKIFVLIDEAYCEFGGESVIDLVRKYKNLIVVRTFSKFLGLAGIKIGYFVTNPILVKKLEFARGPSFAISRMGLVAAEIILSNANLAKKYKKEIDITRENFHRYCLKNKILFCHSITNFVVIKLKCAKKFVKFMEQNGILVKLLDNYIDDKNKVLKSCLRVTLVPMNKMKYFFAVFDKFLKV